jgi:hypothetical protein
LKGHGLFPLEKLQRTQKRMNAKSFPFAETR